MPPTNDFPTRPDLPAKFQSPARDGLVLKDGERFDEQELSDRVFADSRATGLAFTGSCWTKVIARAARWRNIRLCDVAIQSCDFANADWIGAKLLRVELVGCRLIGANLSEASLADVRFTDCRLDQSWFQNTKFERCVFEKCDLTSADFDRADLSGRIAFRSCKLRDAQFLSAKLEGVDFRTSELAGLHATDLRGVIIEPMQAADVAPALGIIVRSGGGD